jgi:predicted nucleic acid-binding protein
MTFADLVAGQQVFLDANTLVYHFGPHAVLGPACKQLLQRIENQELDGFTSTPILTEVAHRMMLVEASARPGWGSVNVRSRLQKQPNVVQGLTVFFDAIETILQSRIQILNITPALVLQAAGISQQTGLLSNDALVVAVMQANGLTSLASHDADFDRVPGLTRYAPA